MALLMLTVMLVPAEIWRAPTDDITYRGFDSNLLFTNEGSTGHVGVTKESIDITASPIALPGVNLATTLLPKLKASVDVSLLDVHGAPKPFRIGVWSPWTGAGQFLLFGPGPENEITAETIDNGGPGSTLIGGDIIDTTLLGHYRLGIPYRVSFVVDRANGRITTSVTLDDGTTAEVVLTSSQSPALFSNGQLSLSASVSAGEGRSHVILQNYSLTLPHQRWWAVKVDDPTEKIVIVALAVLGAVALAFAIASPARALHSSVARLRFRLELPARATVLVAGAVTIYLVGNALLFPLGGHPFDSRNEELYAYVTKTYGLAQLYYVPNFVSLAKIWNGVPYVEAAFPYGPTFGYVYGAIGWLASQLFAAGGEFSPNDVRLLYLIKSMNALFGLADGGLIYLILRQIRVERRWSLIPTAFFLFNPALWFSMSVWGQTHVISLFFVLGAVLMAEKGLPLWAWIALVAALMTRPQMIVFALVLGIVFVRKFPPRQNIEALSWTIVTNFLALLPFTLATSPSLPIDVMLNNFHIQEAGGNQTRLSTVSQSAYSVWPLVTYALRGASGLGRAFTSSSAPVFGNVTYQQIGLVLTVLVLLVVIAVLLVLSRSALDSGGYLPLAALSICSFLMLMTGVAATHFLLALPFLLLCRRWMGNVAYFYVAVIWTITTLVPMFGDMGVAISATDYPVLAPAHNALTRFVVGLYSWDRFITLSVAANSCALVWLAWQTFRRSPIRPNPKPDPT